MKKLMFLFIAFFSVITSGAFAMESDQKLDDLIPAEQIASDVRAHHHDEDLFKCFANNPRGFIFSAVDWIPRRAQDRAMARCFQYSPLCRPLGCRRVY